MSSPCEPYYDDGSCVIYHGDCLEVLPTLGSFTTGFADPPYNYGMNYGPTFNDDRVAAEYVDWCGQWFGVVRAKVDRLFVTPGHGNLQQWMDRKPAGVGCWHKPGNPAGAGIFQFCEWEPILVWGAGRLGGSDVWKATLNPQFKGDVGHPCPKPVKLLTRILTTAKASTVIDPFVGSGTTLVAAKALGVPAVGIERNERYCELAASRLCQEVLDLGGVA